MIFTGFKLVFLRCMRELKNCAFSLSKKVIKHITICFTQCIFYCLVHSIILYPFLIKCMTDNANNPVCVVCH